MRLAYGATRFVFLIGNYAIKFPRFRPFWPFLRFIKYKRQGIVKERLREHHSNLILAVIKYFLTGILVNIDEYKLCKQYPELPFAPTLYTFFGLINVQIRGEPITDSELQFCPFRKLSIEYPEVIDFAKPENFCKIEGQYYLLDYGSDKVRKCIHTEMPSFQRAVASISI